MVINEAVDILSPDFKANPFPFFSRLRLEQPVYPTVLPDKKRVWLLSRYDDVRMLLMDDRFAKDRRNAMTEEQLKQQPWMPKMFRALEKNMLDLDPPNHTRLKNLVHKVFTPQRIGQMQKRIQNLAEELLEKVTGKGEMDLIKDFALPLPMTIITEILGVPNKDRDKFHKWSKVIVSLDQFNPTLRSLPSMWMFIRYLKRFFKMRRAEPKDDLVSALIQVEESGNKLDEDELLAMVFLLLVAGHETTVNLISSGILALIENPDQMNKLREDPELINSAIEELLRYASPVFMSTERYARQDFTIHNITIPRGELVLGVIGSANRDESIFENSDCLNLTRKSNKHLSFGHGIHFCMGAPLARMETQIAINTLLRKFPRIRLKKSKESLRWRSSLILRGLEELPLKFG